MSIEKQELGATAATTRRQFTGLICGTGLLALQACGGGGGGNGPVPAVAPQITLQPRSASVTLGQTVTLTVQASGTNLLYQWRRNGVNLSDATSNTLSITPTSADSGALYTVIVSNSAGQVESLAAVLAVTSVSVPGISLLAGGLGGIGLLEGRGDQARIGWPDNVAVTKSGVVYFSSVDICGTVSAQGDVSFIGNFPYMSVSGMACDSHGDLYACAEGLSVIYKLVNGSFQPFAGTPESYPGGGFLDGVGQAARLKSPLAPAFDAQDNLYFIDRDNHAIRRVTPNGAVSTVAGTPANLTMLDGNGAAAGFEALTSLLVLKDGSLLVRDGTRWRKLMPDGTVTTLPGTVPAVTAVIGVETNSLYAVLGNSLVKLALDGSTVNLAGSRAEAGYVDGLKNTARFNSPASLALSADGQLLVADQQNALLRRVDPTSGQVTSWVGAAPKPGRVDGTGAQARFADMGASCLDRDGNVYVMDTVAKTLRKVTPAGVASTLFTDFPSDGGVAVDAKGNFYGVRNRAIIQVSSIGAQQVWAGQPGVLGYADGAGTAASFAKPMGLVIDAQGNLLVGDSPEFVAFSTLPYFGYPGTDFNLTYGSTIRKITPSGVVSTVAGVPGRVFPYNTMNPTVPTPDTTFIAPSSLTCDAKGTLWVFDEFGLRRIDPQATAPVWVMHFTWPPLMQYSPKVTYAPGSQGDVYLSQGNVIRRLSADGTQTVVAGVDKPDRNGVWLGALPGRLGQVSSILAGAANMLYCCSENSVLRIQF